MPSLEASDVREPKGKRPRITVTSHSAKRSFGRGVPKRSLGTRGIVPLLHTHGDARGMHSMPYLGVGLAPTRCMYSSWIRRIAGSNVSPGSGTSCCHDS